MRASGFSFRASAKHFPVEMFFGLAILRLAFFAGSRTYVLGAPRVTD
jgi:hypothetical protein